jgi:hypothetical protein
MLPFPNRATLSVVDLYNVDETLFDNMALPPDFDTDANRETLINEILMRSKDFEALYPDADFMKTQIKFWSEARAFVWKKVYALTLLEYNPIENYDRMEESSETGQNATERTGEAVSARAGSNSQDQSERRAESSSEAGSESNETKKAGFNTTTLETQSGQSGSSNAQRAATTENTTTGSGTTTETATGRTNENENSNHNVLRTSRIHGNIGVMTPGDMIRNELEIYPELNLIHRIVEDFVTSFCIMVY